LLANDLLAELRSAATFITDSRFCGNDSEKQDCRGICLAMTNLFTASDAGARDALKKPSRKSP